MACTELEDVVGQIREVWSDLFADEYRCVFPLVELIDKTYSAEFGRGNDRAYISQYEAGTGQLLDIDRVAANDNACSFDPAAQVMSRIELIINKRAVSSREFCDTVPLLSQVNPADDKLRQTMAYEVAEQINEHLYSLIVAATPTNELTEATLNAAALTNLTKLADEAKWPEQDRYLLIDPCYHKDLLDAQTLVSVDSVGSSDRPTLAGRFVQERFGWKIVMDNSAGLKTLHSTPGNPGVGIAFNPEFMYWASPRSQFKVSDKHSSLEFKEVMSADTIFGAAIGNDGENKVITIENGIV